MIANPNFPSWRSGWRKPDRRTIYDWAHDNVTLPASYAQPGRFDVSTSRHMIKPFDAIQDDSVREVTNMGAIQTAKSLISEISIAWALCNSPGPTMLTMQTDDDAREHCNQRFFEALRSVRGIKDILPTDRHLMTMTDIYFGPFFLTVNGANISNLQRVSVRWKFNSEVWLWKAGLLAHARGRVSAFEKAGNSKVVNESQGGNEGDDFHEAHKAGNQGTWSAKCFGCGKHSWLEFEARAESEPAKRACVVWNEDAKRADGTWNVGRAAETARWRCRLCGFEHDDTARTRARWNADGDYLDARLDAPLTIRSFRWEALVARPMGALVSQFLEARRQQKQGAPQAMMDFTRQRRALSWKQDFSTDAVLLRGAGYNLVDPKITEKITDETARFLTIDRQKDHFWCLVRAWRSNGSSRLLYFARIQTVEQLREIQERFGVEPNRVFEDSGYDAGKVYDDCLSFGWLALKGSQFNYFPITKNGRTFRRMWSDVTWVKHAGKEAPLIHCASDSIKDILHALRSGKGAAFETPDDAPENYGRQMNGERKQETKPDKLGRTEWRWHKITKDNHGWDLEFMQVCAALMLQILAAPAPPPDTASANVATEAAP